MSAFFNPFTWRTDWTWRTYNWARFLTVDYPAKNRRFRAYVLGFGAEVHQDQTQDFLSVRVGHAFFLEFAFGGRSNTSERQTELAHGLLSPCHAFWFVQLTLLGQIVSISWDEQKPAVKFKGFLCVPGWRYLVHQNKWLHVGG